MPASMLPNVACSVDALHARPHACNLHASETKLAWWFMPVALSSLKMKGMLDNFRAASSTFCDVVRCGYTCCIGCWRRHSIAKLVVLVVVGEV